MKLATWNLCLGLHNKKDTVIREIELIETNCCMQKTEFEKNYPTNILSSKSYEFECEKMQTKEESGFTYIDNHQHVIIIDLFY